MARLPQPGSDDGDWGDILNDFLSQSLKSNGRLQSNSVGSDQLQDNSVTADALAPGAVSASITKSDVGLGDVDNTSDANKPVSTAQQTALNNKESTSNKGQINGYAELDGTGKVPSAQLPAQTNAVSSVNGHVGIVTVTKSDVGLGSVDNTSDAGKPVSTAQLTALNLKAPLASPTFTGTVAGITKSMVGLGSVDNTADTDKPVSTAQATAIAAKYPSPLAIDLGTVTDIDISSYTAGGQTFRLIANAAITITAAKLPAITAGQSPDIYIRVQQNAGATGSIAFAAAILTSWGNDPVMEPTANAITIFGLKYTGVEWVALLVGTALA